ncbi:MAG: class I SAM-dependent methyltransferase [Candidatus Omnitrophota bacterium]
MDIDIGTYNADPEQYKKLVQELYAQHPPITLPPEYASFIEKDMLRFLIRLARYKFVARLIKKSDCLLEIGSGSGLGCIFLSQHCTEATGVELKCTEIEEARSINRRSNCKFIQGDLFELNLPEKFDVVIALDVIEHLTVEQGNRLIAAMASRCKPHGMIVIGSPSIYSYPYQSPLSQASHVHCYEQEELMTLIDQYYHRTIAFTMNDELVHTGYSKMAWYYFAIGFSPKLTE